MMGFFRVKALSFIVLVTCLLVETDATTLSFRRWVSRATSERIILEDTCQCDCCYTVGRRGRTECIPPTDTSFDVPSCTKCSVEACATAFPISCGQPSSLVTSSCIKRSGWMLRVVPVLFLAASAGLLLYACFIKKFDGYHDDRLLASQPSNPLSAVNSSARYHTFRAYGTPEIGSPYARSSATLPPIAEHTEVLPDSEPMGDISPANMDRIAIQPNVSKRATGSDGTVEPSASRTDDLETKQQTGGDQTARKEKAVD